MPYILLIPVDTACPRSPHSSQPFTISSENQITYKVNHIRICQARMVRQYKDRAFKLIYWNFTTGNVS